MDLFKQSVKVKVHLAESFVYVTPSLSEYEKAYQRGVVTVTLAKAKKIGGLRVTLSCELDYSPPGGAFDHMSLWKERIELLPDGGELAAGEHEFPFSIPVEQSSPPLERCFFGRVFYKVTSTAKSVGRSGNDIKSKVVYTTIVATPQKQGLPPPLALDISDFRDDLGAFRLRSSCRAFVVAGAIDFCLNIDSVPQKIAIKSIGCHFLQQFTLSHPKDLTKVIANPSTVSNVFLITPEDQDQGSISAFTVSPGTPYELKRRFRLPTCMHMRPSTDPDSKTPISVANQLVFEISYDTQDGQARALKITENVFIWSCFLWSENVTLPCYSLVDANPDMEHIDRSKPFDLQNRLQTCLRDRPDDFVFKALLDDPKDDGTDAVEELVRPKPS